MKVEMKVAATTKKKPQAVFLCRDWHNAIVKACVVEGKSNIKKVAKLLAAINDTFHYNYDYKNEEYFEFKRDLKLQNLFDALNQVKCEFVDTGCCDVWNTQNNKYYDAYFGF